MASIGEVAKSVSRACDQASKCRDALGQAQDLAEEAHDLLAANLRGAVHLESDTEKVLARFAAVKDGITDLWKILGAGMDQAQAALTALTGEGTPPPGLNAPQPVQPQHRSAERQPPVVGNTGQKTHGRRFGPNGTAEPIVSGRDEYVNAADVRLKGLVPILLPEGATLIVHGTNEKGERFRKQYTGGARPWWR
ncbi:hypothetical protein [Saccharothrix sp. HUAS TT1]|uniref:hypothetical protein n=1 Tax=unclassified Saccharothrix TaxID=2593673 RepID=UPI00345BCFC4